VAENQRKIGLAALIFILLLLAATGKLNWLFALIGVAVAFIARMMPVILRYAPALQRLWFTFKAGKQNAGHSPGSRSHQTSVNKGNITVEQAYQVLGLKPGASRQEIVAAHKRLMMKVHPDKGGSDFLAAQLNRAKDRLLK
jgi:hypothetical protein